MPGTIFDKMARGEVDADKLHEDEACFVIKDINPAAPVHLLVLPSSKTLELFEECEDFGQVSEGAFGASLHHLALSSAVGHMNLVAARVAREAGLSDYRVVWNVRTDDKKTPCPHIHVIGGRDLSWPPG